MMKKFLEIGNIYCHRSTWRDLAVIKFCLCAMGVLIGLQVPKKDKEAAEAAAAGVFLVTYIPLMAKLLRILREEW